MSIVTCEPRHLGAVADLVNLHLDAAIPGWRLSVDALSQHLDRDDAEYVVDPWVIERATLLSLDGYRVTAAAHMLRYADEPDVAPRYRDAAEIGWFVFRPGREAAAAEVLDAAEATLRAWRPRVVYGWGAGLPGPVWGVPDAWPHVDRALRQAGYGPDPEMHREALFGGWLPTAAPNRPAIDGISLQRTVTKDAVRFAALLDDPGQAIGWFDVEPRSNGWADAWDLQVVEPYRRRGVATWLVHAAAAWLRVGGCTRIVIPVTDEDEQAGAGRFYRDRLGLQVFCREVNGWRRVS